MRRPFLLYIKSHINKCFEVLSPKSKRPIGISNSSFKVGYLNKAKRFWFGLENKRYLPLSSMTPEVYPMARRRANTMRRIVLSIVVST